MFHDFLKEKSPYRISELVERQMKVQYPGLHENRLHSLISISHLPLPISSLIAVIFFVTFLVVNEFFIRHGLTITTYELNAKTASDILVSYLGYLAILIGIVIPIVLLIVPYVEGARLSSVMDIYLDRIGVKKTLILTVLVLAIESLAAWFTRISIVSGSKLLFYLTFLLILLNLSVLLETALIISRVIRMLSTKSLLDALLTKLSLEAKKSQQNEARYRFKRFAAQRFYELLHINKVLDFFQASDQIPLFLPFSGLIQDIDISILSQLIDKLQHPAMAQKEEKIIITRIIGDYIDENHALAFISAQESNLVKETQKMLQKAFIVRKPSQETEELQNLLEQLKNRTEFAIRGHDEELFERMISVYAFLFDLYVDLPLPPSADPFPKLYRGWSAIAIANSHLNEITRIASSSGDDQIISHLAYEVYEIAATIISHTETHINESLSDVIQPFVTMYYASYKAGNKTGINQSYNDSTARTCTLTTQI